MKDLSKEDSLRMLDGTNKVVRNLHDLKNFIRKVRDALFVVETKLRSY